MRAASFIEILVDQIRDQVREEVIQELGHAQASGSASGATEAPSAALHQASQVELWLSLNFQPRVSVKRAYGAKTQAARPTLQLASQAPAPAHEPEPKTESRGCVTTVEQFLALDFFNREGSSLMTSFTESEFKAAFRKLALRLHPDRHMQSSIEEQTSCTERFARLTECADILANTLKS
jgi:hypothetical protein